MQPSTPLPHAPGSICKYVCGVLKDKLLGRNKEWGEGGGRRIGVGEDASGVFLVVPSPTAKVPSPLHSSPSKRVPIYFSLKGFAFAAKTATTTK